MKKWCFLLTLLLLGCVDQEPIMQEHSEPASEALDRLLNQTPEATISIHVTSFVNDTKYQNVVTQYISPAGMRTSITESIEGKQLVFDDFMIEEGVFTCVKDGGWVCYEIPALEPETLPESIPEVEEPVITRLPGRTIAGLKAECFTINDQMFSEELCVSHRGIILYKKSSFGSEYVEERVASVQDFVPQSIFTLPGEVSE